MPEDLPTEESIKKINVASKKGIEATPKSPIKKKS